MGQRHGKRPGPGTREVHRAVRVLCGGDVLTGSPIPPILTLTPREWQIRDESFGLAIYIADTGWQALANFLRDKESGDIAARMTNVHVIDNGTVLVDYNGGTYSAVPVPEDAS
jgi:hypothetical protein